MSTLAIFKMTEKTQMIYIVIQQNMKLNSTCYCIFYQGDVGKMRCVWNSQTSHAMSVTPFLSKDKNRNKFLQSITTLPAAIYLNMIYFSFQKGTYREVSLECFRAPEKKGNDKLQFNNDNKR